MTYDSDLKTKRADVNPLPHFVSVGGRHGDWHAAAVCKKVVSSFFPLIVYYYLRFDHDIFMNYMIDIFYSLVFLQATQTCESLQCAVS